MNAPNANPNSGIGYAGLTIYVGDTVRGYRTSSPIWLRDGKVIAIETETGHEGATIYTLTIAPADGRAPFRTTTTEHYAVMERAR